MKSLSLAQQAWLQGMMSHRVVSLPQAKAMHKAALLATHQPYSPDEFYAFNGDVSRAVTQVGIEIRRTKDELTSTEMFVIVNAKGDAAAQLATAFTPQEVVFIKALIRQIFTAPGHAYSLSTMNASALGQEMRPELPTSRVQAICKALIRQDWLQEARGFYSLTLRALVELSNYLTTTFEEHVHACVMCKDIVTKGKACSTPTCSIWVHKGCATQYESSIRSMDRQHEICKGCKKDWDPTEVGKPNARARLQARTSDEVADELGQATPLDVEEQAAADDEEEDEEESAEEDQSQRNARRRKRTAQVSEGSKRRRTVNGQRKSSSEEDEDEDDDDEEEEETVPLQSEEESDEIDSE